MKIANLKTLDIAVCKLIKSLREEAKVTPIRKTYTQMEIPFPEPSGYKQTEIQFPK